MRASILSLLVVASAGCGASIGDGCLSNLDCSPLGDRFCDTAPQGGYCTIEDCDFNQIPCPSEAVCIRFFTPIADEPCTFDASFPFTQSDCPQPDDRCVCDVTNDQGVCVNNAAHCAPSSTERHWCERTCSHDGDCRTGYECRSTGTYGAEPLPTFSNGLGQPTKFCAPKPTSF
jgi:hypothetical protein